MTHPDPCLSTRPRYAPAQLRRPPRRRAVPTSRTARLGGRAPATGRPGARPDHQVGPTSLCALAGSPARLPRSLLVFHDDTVTAAPCRRAGKAASTPRGARRRVVPPRGRPELTRPATDLGPPAPSSVAPAAPSWRPATPRSPLRRPKERGAPLRRPGEHTAASRRPAVVPNQTGRPRTLGDQPGRPRALGDHPPRPTPRLRPPGVQRRRCCRPAERGASPRRPG